MKNLAVTLLFVLSLLGFVATLHAEAHSVVRVEPSPIDAPVWMDEDDSGNEAIAGKDKKKKKGDKKDDDEKDEEEFRISPRGALELVDPGALDFSVRMSAAGLAR